MTTLFDVVQVSPTELQIATTWEMNPFLFGTRGGHGGNLAIRDEGPRFGGRGLGDRCDGAQRLPCLDQRRIDASPII